MGDAGDEPSMMVEGFGDFDVGQKGIIEGELRRNEGKVGGEGEASFSTRNRFGVNTNWAKDKYGLKLDPDFGNGLKLEKDRKGGRSGVDRQMLDVNKNSCS